MLKIYNTQARKKEEFKPICPGKVSMYVCGPTVYNRIHIGNARTFISFDIIRRYLIWSGYDVTFVQNITDVDDKIINKAIEQGCSASEIAKIYSDLFIDDMHKANVMDPDIRPFATKEIGSMIGLVKKLIDNGHAYVVDGDVYFDVNSYKGYGSLSGRDVEDAQSGHRSYAADGSGVENRKRDEADFALWKAAKPGEPSWKSPWGEGRPGWHIECSAMSHKYLGLPFDIHGGGSDLVFPHHENERAQSICAYDAGFANYWMHCGMLQITNEATGGNEKMSKSLNNFIMLHEALEKFDTNVLRMLVLQTHYRSPLVFGDKRLSEASSALDRVVNTVKNMDWMAAEADCGKCTDEDKACDSITQLVDETIKSFICAMDDDFNTPKALGEIFSFISKMNSMNGLLSEDYLLAKNTIIDLMGVFGLDIKVEKRLPKCILDIAKDVSGFKSIIGYDEENLAKAAEAILNARNLARKNKDWDSADAIRDKLSSIGLSIEDTPQGSRIV